MKKYIRILQKTKTAGGLLFKVLPIAEKGAKGFQNFTKNAKRLGFANIAVQVSGFMNSMTNQLMKIGGMLKAGFKLTDDSVSKISAEA